MQLDLSNLTRAQKIEAIKLLEEQARRKSRRRFMDLFPDDGPLRRELYPKHVEFFAAGPNHSERAFIAGNRIGKTTGAAYELTAHLTGRYPNWWPGRKFNAPITAWATGETGTLVRDTIQKILLGPSSERGTGLIPGDDIVKTTPRSGIPEAIDTVTVAHSSGRNSSLVFKSYDQRREAFQGAAVDVVWFDEEPPLDVYMEGLTRIMSTVPGRPNGSCICTFTPLKGLSGVVLLYLPGGRPKV